MVKQRSSFLLVLITAALLAGTSSLFAERHLDGWLEPQRSSFNFLEENDLFVDTDRHYTQGLQFSYFLNEANTPEWAKGLADRLPHFRLDDLQTRFGILVGQDIYTPGDITVPTIIQNDRPYAGFLYLGLGLQRRGLIGGDLPVQDHFQLDLGIIGPSSFASDAQTWVHQIRSFDLPQGWSHQLDTEPGIALKYERKFLWGWETDSAMGLDLIPHAGISLGTTETSVRGGGTIRMGYNLPYDFGHARIQSLSAAVAGRLEEDRSRDWGFHVFGQAELKAVGFSSFLDGNVFQTSHHVNRIPFVAEFSVGAAARMMHVEFICAMTLRSKEFDQQKERNAYGTVSINVKF